MRWFLRIIIRLESLVEAAVDQMIQNTAEWVMKILRKTSEGVKWEQMSSEDAIQLLTQATASDKLGGGTSSQTVVTYAGSIEKQCGGLTHPHTFDLLLSTAKGKTD